MAIATSAKSRLFYSFFDISPEFQSVRPIVRMNYVKSEIAGFSKDKVFLSYGAAAYYLFRKYYRHGKRGLDTDFGIEADSHFVADGMALSLRALSRNLSVEIRVGF